MSKDKPKDKPEPQPPESWQRFVALAKKVVNTPVEEVKKLEQEEAERQKQQEAPSQADSASSTAAS